jgi:hypothetical protein
VVYDEIKSEYGDNVYYCVIHWLDKDKVLQSFLALLEVIKVFVIEKGQSVILKMQFGYVIQPS